MAVETPRPEQEQWLEQALQDLLQPLARLCLGHGLPFARVEELLKRAYVVAARQQRSRSGASARRDVSQIAVATGLHRRDVARISEAAAAPPARRLSPATQVVTLWLSDPGYRERGEPLHRVPRQGPAPSFEALALAVTRHVHPRSLLEEAVRLGLVKLEADSDTVLLLKGEVVPDPRHQRLYSLLGANVGDHLSAATHNVLGLGPRHPEQAVFAQGLSDESVQQAQQLVRQQWSILLQALAPELQRLIEADRSAGRPGRNRVRVGLYSYQEELPLGGGEEHETPG